MKYRFAQLIDFIGLSMLCRFCTSLIPLGFPAVLSVADVVPAVAMVDGRLDIFLPIPAHLIDSSWFSMNRSLYKSLILLSFQCFSGSVFH